MRRTLLTLLPAFLLLTSCNSNLGRDTPDCEKVVTSSIIMQIQAIQGTAYVPCLNALPVGWTYRHVEPRSGNATFRIDSDRIGLGFLTVVTTPTCDVTGYQPAVTDEPPIELFQDVAADLIVPVVIVPEGPTDETVAAARALVLDMLGLRLSDRLVEYRIDMEEAPTNDRIRAAHASGAHVLSVSIRDAEEGRVTLLLADTDEELPNQTLQSAIDEIEDATSRPTYRGSWLYVFEGGCTELEFNARGPGAESVAVDVQQSLGFVDAEIVRQGARDAGFDLP